MVQLEDVITELDVKSTGMYKPFEPCGLSWFHSHANIQHTYRCLVYKNIVHCMVTLHKANHDSILTFLWLVIFQLSPLHLELLYTQFSYSAVGMSRFWFFIQGRNSNGFPWPKMFRIYSQPNKITSWPICSRVLLL